MRVLVVVSTLLLVACGGPPKAPIVDMAGKDLVQYNRDLADCHKNPPVVGLGNYVEKCMKKKGYTVLMSM